MAVTKILVIRTESHLSKAIDYVTDTEKTLEKKYVGCINCTADSAAEKMATTKKQIGKQGGRLGYHIIQSFAPGEVEPELAHKISMEYAEHWLSDFEVMISTHLDRGHLHSHLICNSVSCVTGNKLHLSRDDFYKKVRGISDELCEKYNLSVIEKGREYAPKQYVRKDVIIADIEDCIAKSSSIGEFYVLLENMGYKIDLSGAHVKIRHSEDLKNRRMKTLGYPPSVLKRRILGEISPRVFRAYRRKRFEKKPLTKYKAMYLYYMYSMGKLKHSLNRDMLPLEEYRKFSKYKAQMRFLAQNEISSLAEICLHSLLWQKQLNQLNVEKFRLRGAVRKFGKLFNAHSVYTLCFELAIELSEEQNAELNSATAYMDKCGYSNKYDAIAATRVALADAKEKNREEILNLKHKLFQLEKLCDDHKNICRNMGGIDDALRDRTERVLDREDFEI